MNADSKRILGFLGGALGIAVISVSTTLVMQKILQKPPAEPTPVAEQAVVVPQPPTAQIISVKPHYISVSVPHKSCHQTQHVVYQRTQSTHPATGAVVGGVAGALVGQTVGGDEGARLAATAAGAAIGALSGHAIQSSMNQPKPHIVYGTVCSTTHTSKQQQKGYEVTYMFNGQQGTILMDNAPIGSVLTLPIQGATALPQ